MKLAKYFFITVFSFSLIACAGAMPVRPDKQGFTALERDVIKEVNFARTKPKEYAKVLEKHLEHYDGKLIKYQGKINLMTVEGGSAVKEAIGFLKKQKPLSPLTPSRGLTLASADHVADQSDSGKVGHSGRDDSTPFDRMVRYGAWLNTAGENIDYGNDEGRRVVMALIIDDNYPSRGHRINIFDKDFGAIGVACGTHPVYRHMCVMGLAGGFTELENKGNFSVK